MGAVLSFLKALWAILNRPDNDPILVGLLVAFVGLIVAHASIHRSFVARLLEKDKRIEDLVEQRNLFQEELLKRVGIKRKSSKAKKK